MLIPRQTVPKSEVKLNSGGRNGNAKSRQIIFLISVKMGRYVTKNNNTTTRTLLTTNKQIPQRFDEDTIVLTMFAKANNSY